jgi:hypothetical protein
LKLTEVVVREEGAASSMIDTKGWFYGQPEKTAIFEIRFPATLKTRRVLRSYPTQNKS